MNIEKMKMWECDNIFFLL